MSKFLEFIVPGLSTAINGIGFANNRMNRPQRGKHPRQEAGTRGDGAKKQTPEYGKRKRNGRHDRTRHASKHSPKS